MEKRRGSVFASTNPSMTVLEEEEEEEEGADEDEQDDDDDVAAALAEARADSGNMRQKSPSSGQQESRGRSTSGGKRGEEDGRSDRK